MKTDTQKRRPRENAAERGAATSQGMLAAPKQKTRSTFFPRASGRSAAPHTVVYISGL